MAKAKGGLFSLKAQGRLGDAVAFRGSHGQTVLQKISPSGKPASAAQAAAREEYQKACLLWHSIPASQQTYWQTLSRHASTNKGFSDFLKIFLKLSLPTPSQGCVMFLAGQGDEPGGTIYDLSGLANNGTLQGAGWAKLASGLWINTFDGINDYINCGNAVSTRLQTFTFLFWCKTSQVSNPMAKAPNNASGWQLQFNSTNDVYFGDNFVNIGLRYDPCPYNPINNTWQLWGGYRQDGSHAIGMIRNGQVIKTGTYAGDYGYGDINIGRRNPAQACYVKGQMALARYYNTVLSPSEIQAIYDKERTLFGV